MWCSASTRRLERYHGRTPRLRAAELPRRRNGDCRRPPRRYAHWIAVGAEVISQKKVFGGIVDVERPCPKATEIEGIPGCLGENTMAGKTSKKSAKVTTKAAAKPSATNPVKLLSGGNPQIAKAYGDAPVQAYIAAMPGWKRDVGRRLDALIVRTVPDVYKAVKWNSPFYGLEGQGWFLGIHCFTKYIKLAFFRGTSLRPVPPGGSKQKEVRYLDIHEDDELDEAQLAAWVKQASQLPGERM